jgi:SulP family sulfate permease
MYGLPKLTKKIPAALIAIIVVACVTIFGGIEVSTVGSFIKMVVVKACKGAYRRFKIRYLVYLEH